MARPARSSGVSGNHAVPGVHFWLFFWKSGIHLMGFRMFILPFSPRWLVEQGRHDDALVVIQRLHGTTENKDFIDLEFAEMSVL